MKRLFNAVMIMAVLFGSAAVRGQEVRPLPDQTVTAQPSPLRQAIARAPLRLERLPRPQRQPGPHPGSRTGRRVAGAVAGAVGGLLIGGVVGAKLEPNCHCDDPGLKGFVIGAPIGAIVGGVLGARLVW
jgi:hypothetical protein